MVEVYTRFLAGAKGPFYPFSGLGWLVSHPVGEPGPGCADGDVRQVVGAEYGQLVELVHGDVGVPLGHQLPPAFVPGAGRLLVGEELNRVVEGYFLPPLLGGVLVLPSLDPVLIMAGGDGV